MENQYNQILQKKDYTQNNILEEQKKIFNEKHKNNEDKYHMTIDNLKILEADIKT